MDSSMIPVIWRQQLESAPGKDLYRFAQALFPICRSLTGAGVRKTLGLIQEKLPQLKLAEVPSGTRAFDWTIPDEWNIRDASIIGPDGEKLVDFKRNNLHVVGYSEPVNRELTLEELTPHLYSLPEQPDAIPYVTSYYKKSWGFCVEHNRRKIWKPGKYRVQIDSTLQPGSLTYGELVLPGDSQEEVLFSTYVCHPSLANNEVSGPVVATYLAKWISELPRRRYTYRFFFGPETIGPIAYLSKNLDELKKRIKAGYVLTCVGDNRGYSFLPSRKGSTLADRVALTVLDECVGAQSYRKYSFLDRGSDERQYCSPGADLPVASVMRSKYGEYPEYHTSLDNLSLISAEGLGGALGIYQSIVTALEANERFTTAMPCEPQLGKRGLYPSVSTKETHQIVKSMMDLLAYLDGSEDLVDVCRRTGLPLGEALPIVGRLLEAGVIKPAPRTE